MFSKWENTEWNTDHQHKSVYNTMIVEITFNVGRWEKEWKWMHILAWITDPCGNKKDTPMLCYW